MTMSDTRTWPFLAIGLSQSRGVVAVVLLFIVFVLGATYLITFLESQRAYADSRQGKQVEPPQAPYAVPWLGNTLSFALDPDGYIWKMQKFFEMAPFRMKVAGEKFVFVPRGDLISTLFKSSRDLNNKALVLAAVRDQFGVPERDLEVWLKDDSGVGVKPNPGFENWPTEKRAHFVQYHDLHGHLKGPALELMVTHFLADFTRELASRTDISGQEWTTIPDLYHFFRGLLFESAVRALCGRHIFEVCPNFCEVFWEFDKGVSYLLRRAPRWLFPKTHAARDKVVASVKIWHKSAREHFDWSNENAVEAEWEPVYGARLMRRRQEMFKNLGLSDDGSASLDTGLIWAVNANIVPASMWGLLHIIRSPSVLARVLAEIESSHIPGTDKLDIAVLSAKPLLNSIYLEALRYSVAIAVARNPTNGPVKLGTWTIKPDATVLSVTWHGSHDASFWNAGRDNRHSVHTFWPERFLEYPDDPHSGPIKKKSLTSRLGTKTCMDREITTEDDKRAILNTNGHQEFLYPYGGGVNMCPGRFFAKQEMLITIALMLREFEIEITDDKAADEVKPNSKYFLVGSMPPDREIPVRIRRRQKTH